MRARPITRLQRPAALWLACALLTGCAAAPPPPTAAEVAAPPETVRARIVAYLQARAFLVAQGGGPISATGGALDPGWAACGTIFYNDPYADVGQIGSAQPALSSSRIEVAIAPAAGGSSVAVQAAFAGTYVSRFSAVSREARCPSTGKLERSILAAASGT